VAVLVGVALLAVLLPAPVLVLAGVPLAAALWLLRSRWERAEAPELALLGLTAVGSGLILIAEFFYIQDVFNGRFNTLFKVYYQVWTLLGVAAAVGVALAWRWSEHVPVARRAVGVAVATALVAGLAYPVVSIRGWTTWEGPREWRGLDGAAFIGDSAPGDLAAIRWLADNATADDVILEAPGCSYQINGGVPTNRFSAFTGVPAIVGWGGHESQWRGGQPELLGELGARQSQVATLYDTLDPMLLDRYGVTLIAAGSFEREGAGGACALAGPFPSVQGQGFPGPGWSEVFSQDGATIWRRDGTG
jgi:uncharacterized membrane protein